MSQHVPEDLLGSFVDGDVGEQLAVHIAEHLDECPACATRATGLEPLAAAFASVDDPLPPADLVQAVMQQVSEPERVPVLEIALGAAMLVSAALLTTTLGNPLGMAIELGVVLHAMASMARALAAGIAGSSLVMILTTAVTVAGCLVTLRLANPDFVSQSYSLNRRLP